MEFDPLQWKQAFDTAKGGLDLVRGAFAVFKDAKEVLSDDTKKKAVEASIEHAEKVLAQAAHQIQLAEAQAARALGYHLCQCTFPPQIMRSIGYHERGEERFECPRCKKKHPSDHHFQQMARVDRHNRGGGSGGWMGN